MATMRISRRKIVVGEENKRLNIRFISRVLKKEFNGVGRTH
jgi:hypothetical protein